MTTSRKFGKKPLQAIKYPTPPRRPARLSSEQAHAGAKNPRKPKSR